MKTLNEVGNEIVPALTAAFENAGVMFKDRAGALASFKSDHTIIVTEDGGLETIYGGVRQPLHLALRSWSRTGTGEVFLDRRTLPKDERGIVAKDQLTTIAEKTAFIAKNGGLAYEKLATTHQSIEETQYRDEYYKLSRSQKVELLKKGVDASSFPPRPDPDQIAGGRVNKTALERDKATRPNQK